MKKNLLKNTITVINIVFFNRYEEKPFEEYNINYSYYLQRANREIESARGSQLKLIL